jgi:hypothetical protein
MGLLGKDRKVTAGQKRMVVYLLVLLSFAGWRFIPRPWHPTLTLETPQHRIFSTATREQTEATARALELLWQGYSNRFAGLPRFESPAPLLQVKLFKDRAEFRRVGRRRIIAGRIVAPTMRRKNRIPITGCCTRRCIR